MLVRYLQSLRTHGEWADARLLGLVRDADADVTRVLRELAHIRGAQDVWLARIQGGVATIAVWPEWSAADLEREGAPLDARLREAFARLTPESLAEVITYKNVAGTTFSTPLGDILFHVLTHGQYHRGKANAALRDAGAGAIDVDYIIWQRETTPSGVHRPVSRDRSSLPPE